MIQSGIRPYLGYAVGATVGVVGIPVIATIVVLFISPLDAPFLLAAIMGASMGVAMATVGSLLWNRRPESEEVTFYELMLWNYIRRARAERLLDLHVQTLGLAKNPGLGTRTQLSPDRRLAILHELASALEQKDPYLHGHSRRVQRLATKTAAQLGLSEKALDDLRTAASLHDVGKISVPDCILRKPGKLTAEERALIQEHAEVGSWMISGVGSRTVVDSVRHHHERWDGRGYPDGKSSKDIPLPARIIAVADSFDAMTSKRPYRSPLSREEAVQELRIERGAQFDPIVVDAFMTTLETTISIPGMVAFPLLAGKARRLAKWARRATSPHFSPAMGITGATAAVIAASSVLFSPGAKSSEPGPSESGASAIEASAEEQVGIAAKQVAARLERAAAGGATGRGAAGGKGSGRASKPVIRVADGAAGHTAEGEDLGETFGSEEIAHPASGDTSDIHGIAADLGVSEFEGSSDRISTPRTAARPARHVTPANDVSVVEDVEDVVDDVSLRKPPRK